MAAGFPSATGPRGTTLPVRTDPTGSRGPTRVQARGPGWRRTSRGLYVPSAVDGERLEQRIVEAAAVLPERHAAITGWAALAWAGARWFTGARADGSLLPVTIATTSWIRPQPGIAPVEERLLEGDLVEHDGLRVTSIPRAVCFEMRHAPSLRQAVAVLDMAAAYDVCSIEEAAGYAVLLSSWTGIPQCRAALALADENSWSPQETAMRMAWMLDAGLPRPLANQPIFDRLGRHVATPDLLDLEAGVVGEYDGSAHLDGGRRARDLEREDAVRRLGLECFTLVAGDLTRTLDVVVPRMLAARERARWEPASTREWTIEPPRWWRGTTTVRERRGLSPADRARLLRHLAA